MKKKRSSILAISGGGDSRYLLELLLRSGAEMILAHVHHGTRGKESDKDQEFVENIAGENRIPLFTARMPDRSGSSKGFENRARRFRRRFLLSLKEELHCRNILTGHTSDDQVETILMRMFEGVGIGGLKGIRRETADGFYRPILHIWREDIFKYLKENRIPFRTDRTNRDTRFERNWIRHVLIPLLVKRYGKAVKKRIFTLGERFGELDEYLDTMADRWMRRNIPLRRTRGCAFRRKAYSRLPTVLRVKVLQKVCFERLGIEPGERLLEAMDRIVREGGPSARLTVAKGWELSNRYEETRFTPSVGHRRAVPAKRGSVNGSGQTSDIDRRELDSQGKGKTEFVLSCPGKYHLGPHAGYSGAVLAVESRRNISPLQARRRGNRAGREFFDASGLRLPLAVRPVCAGDRIRPFGLHAEKKVKEILIERKVPRDERWGRPAVRDAEGKILWIPGVVRSAHAPVTATTRRTIVLSFRAEAGPGKRKNI